VAGEVSISNLPAVQEVTGGVIVSNLPDVQEVDGTVNIGNLSELPISATTNDDGSKTILYPECDYPATVTIFINHMESTLCVSFSVELVGGTRSEIYRCELRIGGEDFVLTSGDSLGLLGGDFTRRKIMALEVQAHSAISIGRGDCMCLVDGDPSYFADCTPNEGCGGVRVTILDVTR